MAIRLCHACSCEVNEGDRICRHCNAILDKSSAVIEVVGDDGGFSFGSNRNAYEDEALKNFKQEHMDVHFEELGRRRIGHSSIESLDDYNEESFDADIDEGLEFAYSGIFRIFKRPKEYIAFIVAVIGVILLVTGVFLPLYNDSVGNSHYVYKDEMSIYGFAIIAMSVVALLMIFRCIQKFIIIPSLLVMSFLAVFVIMFLGNDVFDSVGIGYYILWFGSITMCASAFLISKSEERIRFGNIVYGDAKNKPVAKHDFVWILLTLFLSVIIVNILMNQSIAKIDRNNNIVDNSDNKGVTTVSVQVSDHSGSMKLTVKDTYIVNNGDELAAVVEVQFENDTDTTVSFNDIFNITALQNGVELNATELEDSIFDLNTPGFLVSIGSTQSIYFGYSLVDYSEIKVNINKKNNEPVVTDQTMALNNQYLNEEDKQLLADATDDDTDNSDVNDQQDNQQGINTDVTTTAEPDTNNTSDDDSQNNESESENTTIDTTKSPVSTKEPTVVATEAPVVTEAPVATVKPTANTSNDCNIYVTLKDSSNWGATLYVYLYIWDESKNELIVNQNIDFPGVKMQNLGNGQYKFTCDEYWYGKGRFIISDGTEQNQFPADDTPGILINDNNFTYSF